MLLNGAFLASIEPFVSIFIALSRFRTVRYGGKMQICERARYTYIPIYRRRLRTIMENLDNAEQNWRSPLPCYSLFRRLVILNSYATPVCSLYVYIYMYISIHTYTRTRHVHAYVHTYTYTRMHPRVSRFAYASIGYADASELRNL